jgi:hypothetical protein
MQMFLGYYSAHHPFLNWAVTTLLPDYRVLYYALLYSSDVVLFLLLALPYSIALQYLLPRRPWIYLITAASVVFVWEYRGVWSDFESLANFLTSPSAYIGIVITLGLLPLAYSISVKPRARYAT